MKTILAVLCLCLLIQVPAVAQNRTAYQTAVRAVRALETSFPQFISYVHPVKGVFWQELSNGINKEQPFSRAQLQAASRKGAVKYPFEDYYDDPAAPKSVDVVHYITTIIRGHHFSATKDIRRNVTLLAYSSDLFPAAKPGETLISFHLTDPANELGWHCLVVRTEVYKGNTYVTGLNYLYWTP